MRSRRLLTAACLAVVALVPTPATTAGADAPQPVGRAAPYLYLGWGNPPAMASYTNASGINHVTLAFMLSRKTCSPAWDGNRPLLGGADEAAIMAIRAAGGDVVVSFGGWSGRKLGTVCKTSAALAAAYQQVIDAYTLRAIDIDIERGEFTNRTTRRRVIDALGTVAQRNPGLEIYVTLGTGRTAPDPSGLDLISYAAARGFSPTAWVAMPFDFGGPVADMATATVTAMNGFATAVATASGIPLAAAYTRTGISTMNGLTDDTGAVVTLAGFSAIRDWARDHALARLSFWAVNRDRPCTRPSPSSQSDCSGVAQTPWAFSQLLAQF